MRNTVGHPQQTAGKLVLIYCVEFVTLEVLWKYFAFSLCTEEHLCNKQSVFPSYNYIRVISSQLLYILCCVYICFFSV